MADMTTIKVTDKEARWINGEVRRINENSLTKQTQASVLETLINEFGVSKKMDVCPQCGYPFVGNCNSCNPRD